jgi:peroxiredoxin
MPDFELPDVHGHVVALSEQHTRGPVLVSFNREGGIVSEFPDDVKQVYFGAGFNIPEANGEDVWGLPIPATFVVDRDGVVTWAFVNSNYTKRLEPSELVRVAKEKCLGMTILTRVSP